MRARICCPMLLDAPLQWSGRFNARTADGALGCRGGLSSIAGAGGRIRTCEAFRRRFYRPVVLATHPPRHSTHLSPIDPVHTPTSTPARSPSSVHQHANRANRVEPKGGFEPPTCRLQIGCAANCATWARLDPKPNRTRRPFFCTCRNQYAGYPAQGADPSSRAPRGGHR